MAGHTEDKPPKFVSLGMVVVDELRSPGKPPLLDIPGGSGAFSTFGARLVAGKEKAAGVGCFILAGNDFPKSVLDRFAEWDIDLTVKFDAEKKSTRGLLEYHDVSFSRKTFRYTTKPLQPTPKDLPLHFLGAAAYHLLAGPSYVEDHADELACRRPYTEPSSDIKPQHRPLLVWEPLPIQVKAQTKDAHLAACMHVDIFSPNHLELMTFFRGPISEADADDDHFDRKVIEEYAGIFLEAGIGQNRRGTIVVRCGSQGCLVASLQMEGQYRWLPAFSFADSITGRKIVDATGAGNTFLGALTFAVADGRDELEAAKYGNVAASFALEQIGLATLNKGSDGQGERWNGESFDERYREYEVRLLTES